MNRLKSMVVLMALMFLGACTVVPPGYAGIVVNQVGDQKGVQDFPVKTGRIFYNPVTQDVATFPVFQQNVVWSLDKDRDMDRSFVANSSEGAKLNFDVSASVSFVADSVPKIYTTFRKDADEIIDFAVRQRTRKAFSDRTSRMTAVEFFGARKKEVQDSVLADVRAVMSTYGITVEAIEIVGEVRVDANVKSSINAVLTAAQNAIGAQNKVAQSIAEGEQRVAAARADSTAAVVRAAGQARANELLRSSVTELLLQKQMIERWNGVLPTVQGGNPMITLPRPN